MKKLLLVLLAFIMVVPAAFAHSGRTDSNGGHWDHSTGTYHYHNGGGSSGGSGSRSGSNSSSSGSVSYEPILNLNKGDVLETKGNVNVRSGAGSDYSIVLTISSGSQVSYAGKTSGRWHYVEFITDDGPGSGWMYNDYLAVVSRRPVPTEEPEPTNSPTPEKATKKDKAAIRMNVKLGMWCFVAGFVAGMVILYLYHRKVNDREYKMRIEAENNSRSSYELGRQSERNNLYCQEKSLEDREKSLENREKEFEKKSTEFMKEVERIKSELPPPENYCFVMYSDSYSGYGRRLYHKIGSSCISTGKRIALYEAKMRNLYPCERCHPPIHANSVDIKNTWEAK